MRTISTRWQWDRPLRRFTVIISPVASRRERWYAVLSPGVTTTTSCPAMLPDKSTCGCCASVLLERRLYGRPRAGGCGFNRQLPTRWRTCQVFTLTDYPTLLRPLHLRVSDVAGASRIPCFSQSSCFFCWPNSKLDRRLSGLFAYY
jgi:hypothetical protein